MELNLHIIAYDLRELSPRGRFGSNRSTRRLRYPALLTAESSIDPDVVFLVDSRDPACARMLEPASSSGCFIVVGSPLSGTPKSRGSFIWIPQDLPLPLLLDRVQRVFSRYTDWHIALQASLLRGKSLDRLGVLSSEVFEKPVIVYDRFYQTVLYAYGHSQHPELPDRKINFTIPANEVESIRRDTHYFHLRKPYCPESFKRSFGYEQLCYNLFHKGEKIGVLAVQEAGEGIADRDWALIKFLGELMEQSFSSDIRLSASISGNLNSKISKLLEGADVSESEVAGALRDVGWRVDDRYLCMTVGGAGSLYSPSALLDLAQRICQGEAYLVHAIKDAVVVLVCNCDKAAMSVGEIVNRIREKLLNNGHAEPLGVSLPFYSLSHLRYYHRQCLDAIELGMRAGDETGIMRFEDYVLDYIARICGEKTLPESLFPEELKVLGRHDKLYRTDHCSFLEAYLENDRSVTKTAESFHVHRNTVQNRLDKIAQITGADLDDPMLRARLFVSLVILSR